MTIYFSASTGGFYDSDIHGKHVPSDAVEIAAEDHAALLDAQGNGKVIVADKSGAPVAIDRPAPTVDELWASARRKRDDLLAASDWTQVLDAPLSAEAKEAWAEYRQALRDVTKQADPSHIVWPKSPA